MPNNLLLVDMSWLAYRSAAAHPLLESRRVFTGGLYGFFTSFAKAMRETRATQAAFCLDVKPYIRSQQYADYKMLRNKNIDDAVRTLRERQKLSLEQILWAFQECGLETWGIPGFEFDDLAAFSVRRYRHRFDMIYAMSNDSDLYQLLDVPNFAIYRTDMQGLVTLRSLRTMFAQPITPADYMLMTALTGTHNDVAGIPKVGPVTALKIIRDPALLRRYRESHGALIDRNLDLIRLPHPQFPRGQRLPEHSAAGFNPRQLYRSLGKYDIDVTSSMVSAFEQLLKGNRPFV